MENNRKEIEKEDEIDVRKIYLTNFKPHKPRVGKQYQAIIPECISSPKPKENKNINENKDESIIKNNNNKMENDNTKHILNNNKEEEIKNEIIGHKTYIKKSKSDNNDNEYIPSKKKKI